MKLQMIKYKIVTDQYCGYAVKIKYRLLGFSWWWSPVDLGTYMSIENATRAVEGKFSRGVKEVTEL
jgi:hypothetical protein